MFGPFYSPADISDFHRERLVEHDFPEACVCHPVSDIVKLLRGVGEVAAHGKLRPGR